MKKTIMGKLWFGLWHSTLYQFVAALIWTVFSYTILWNMELDYGWWLLIPGITALFVVGITIGLLVFAWIINPIRTARERYKEQEDND